MELSARTPERQASDSSTLVEYIELQGSAEMVTKSELIQAVRGRSLSISDRNLSYYTTSGLIPPAVRVGSRGGVYPKIVVEQLAWVINARSAQLSLEAIRELLPLWRTLVRGRKDGVINLAEIELVAQRDLSMEANYRVPYLFSEVLSCLCPACLSEVEWILKDGSKFHHTEETPLSLGFILARINEDTGGGEIVSWTQMALPYTGSPDPAGPTTITLGVPMGVAVKPPVAPASVHPPKRRPRERQAEVLPVM